MPTLLGVSGAAVRKPKSTRKGHPHAFRLEVIPTEARVEPEKFVFSVGSETELKQWMLALQEGSGILDQPDAMRGSMRGSLVAGSPAAIAAIQASHGR